MPYDMSNTHDLRGNIVLFQSYGMTLAEEEAASIVKAVTYGPYVHAAIIVDDKLNLIEARLDGIHRGVLLTKNNGTPSADYQICTIYSSNHDSNGRVTPIDSKAVDRAILWLEKQADADTPYGWCDIATQGLDWLLMGRKLIVEQPGRYDCSNLAAMFLAMCGVNLPFPRPFDVSPNDLAEFFGLLPNRHRVYPK